MGNQSSQVHSPDVSGILFSAFVRGSYSRRRSSAHSFLLWSISGLAQKDKRREMNHLISDDQLVKLAQSVANMASHVKPSKETLVMIEELDKKFDKLGHSVDLHVQDFKYFKDEMANKMDVHQRIQDETLKELRSQIDSKAGKWVEGALRWATYLIIGAVVVALLELVIKK